MTPQQGHAVWTCSIYRQHGHATLTGSTDTQIGQAARTGSTDMQHGQTAWTSIRHMQHDKQYGHAPRTCLLNPRHVLNKQNGQAAGMQHEHAA
jgi:hypothetical protein